MICETHPAGRSDATDIPVVVGGIILPEDAEVLIAHGVAQVFTPKDFELTDIVDLIRSRGGRQGR